MKTSPYWKRRSGLENSNKGGVKRLEAHVVRDFQIGNTGIKIADNYCKKTACEVERLLKHIAEQAQRQFIAAAATGKHDEQQKNKETSAAYH